MRVDLFDFELPSELIAQVPPAERGSSRLLRLDRGDGTTSHHAFADLPTLLSPGDLLVVNDTRVFPARLIGRRLPGGGGAECLLVRPAEEPDTWIALVHPGQRLKAGSRMVFERAGVALEAEVISRHFHGRRVVRLHAPGGQALGDAIEAVGHVPLPPYVKRPDDPSDRERYQTVFANAVGSIAAPTAGLHFTASLLDDLDRRGIERVAVTLHVGYGTFQPVRVDLVDEHQMEAERFEVGAAAALALSRALADRRRVIAVGTTTTRTLESVVQSADGAVAPQQGETALFIRPGHEFRIVTGLVTNFHLPRSSLLMLVSAFAGRQRVLAAYAEAVRQRYRFFSYGDAMVIL